MATLLWRENAKGEHVAYARHIYYVNGKRKEKKECLKTTDAAVARRRLAKWTVINEANKWGDTAISFDEAWRSFRKEHCASLKESSVDRYETSFRQLQKNFSGRDIKQIRKSDLLSFEVRRRMSLGRNRRDKVRPSSIRRDLLALSSMMSYAVLKEWIEYNPVKDFLKARAKSGLTESDPRRRYLSEEEEARMIQSLATSPGNDRDRQIRLAFFISAIDLGGRNDSELLQMRWSDVQFGSRPSVTFPETKGGRPRRVPMFDRVSKVLQELPRHPTSAYVFHHSNGKPYRSFRHGILTAAARANIKDITEHDFRRTCGCRLLQRHKRSMVEVSKWLGHSSIKVTERIYAFLRDEDLDEIVVADRERSAELAKRPSAEIVNLRRGA